MDRHSFKTSNSRHSFSFSLYHTFSYFLITCLLILGTTAAPSSKEHTSSESHTVAHASSTKTPSSTSASDILPVATPTEAADYVVPTPRAFDTSMQMNNFTSPGCQPFFQNFLNNATFINCLPLSFFLQNSKSWFDITKQGLIPVTKALDASCSVDTDVCNILMNDLGRQLLDVGNCGADFKSRNPVVLQAYASFLTYPIMFAAGCQRSTTGYCYADAITNSSNAADIYTYFMPLGIAIPGGARLTCSSCLQKTMKIYAQAANNKSLPLSATYVAGAQLVNLGCGPDFANTTIPEMANSATSLRSRTWIPTATIIAILSLLFF